MKQLFIILLTLGMVFCISCKRNSDIIVGEDGSKSKKVVMEQNPDDTPKVVYYYKLDKDGNLTKEVTREEHFYTGGKKYVEGNIKKGRRNGKWFAYFQNGAVQTSAFFVDGLEDGEYKVFRENGKLFYTGQYNKGVRVGEWKRYDENGKLTQSVIVEEGKLSW